MNKISKDIIVRSKSMAGYYAPYIPGWDTHGLPIEQVLAKQGVKRKELDLVEYLNMCRDYALSQVEKQKEDFEKLANALDCEILVVEAEYTLKTLDGKEPEELTKDIEDAKRKYIKGFLKGLLSDEAED